MIVGGASVCGGCCCRCQGRKWLKKDEVTTKDDERIWSLGVGVMFLVEDRKGC